ncbi:MAG TPA: polysaccharide biosynthesis tyrosine autokinase [Candidatus Atribacteria bacterium]|nr:polysaccharide biosynthesis tyrosine autokinase [Candidatus Atribacteria bacterium]
MFVVQNDPKSPISEAFRTLRTNIKFSSLDKPIKTLLITSPIPEAGKSSISINLALTMAQDKYKVILVDTDLRKPTIHKIFEQDNKTGLTNILVEDKKIKDVMRKMSDVDPNLYFIPSGPIPPNPSELLGSNKMKELLKELQEQADFVIFDSPPVIAVTDALVLATQVDGVVLVLNFGEVPREAAIQTKELLNKVKANILGVVLNKIDMEKEGQYYPYYYYYYYGDETKKKKQKRK